MATIRGLSAVLSADNRRLRSDLRKARYEWRRYSQQVSQDMKRLTRAVGVASAAATAAVGALGRSALQTADQIAKSARNAGLAVEGFQELSHAFELAGSSADSLVKGNQSLQRAIYDYGRELSTQVDAFESLGIQYEQIARLAPVEQFLLVRQRLSEIEDLTKRSALAQVLLGRAGKQLGTVLSQNNEEFLKAGQRLRSFGGVLNSQATRAAEHFNDEMTVLGRVLRINFAQGFIQALGSIKDTDNILMSAGQAARTFGRSLIQTVKIVREFWTEIKIALGVWLTFKAALIAAAFISGIKRLFLAFAALVKILKVFALTVIATQGAVVAVPLLIVSLAAAIVAVGTAIVTEWERIKDSVIAFKDAMILNLELIALHLEYMFRSMVITVRNFFDATLGFIEDGINSVSGVLNDVLAKLGLEFRISEVNFEGFEAGTRRLEQTNAKTLAELQTVRTEMNRILAEEVEIGAAFTDGLANVGTIIKEAVEPLANIPDKIRELLDVGDLPKFDEITSDTQLIPQAAQPTTANVFPEETLIEKDLARFKDDFESTLANTFRQGNFDDLGTALLTNIRNQFTDRVASNIAGFVGNFFSGLFNPGGSFGGGLFGGGIGIFGGLFGGIFHQGGIVPGVQGQQRLILAEAGEAVIPRNRIGDIGDATITVNQQITGDVTTATRRALRTSATEITDIVYSNLRERGALI